MKTRTIALACAVMASSLNPLLEQLIEDQILDNVAGSVEESLEQAFDALSADVLTETVDEIAPRRAVEFVAAVDEEGRKIEQGVWVILVETEQLESIRGRGFKILEQRPLAVVDRVLLRIEAPADRALAQAVLDLATEFPNAKIDFNHVYRNQSRSSAAPASGPAEGRVEPVDLSVAIIDTAVARRHEALRKAAITQRDFVPFKAERPKHHGTAVASILVGDGGPVRGLLPGARLHAASVFFTDKEGTELTTTTSLVRALDWAVASGARVVNMSLTGPPNRVLEEAISRVADLGAVVVAAVGNAGPAAAPLYPAAYDDVVGITALDPDDRVFRYAVRGRQVSFAAPGVDVQVAHGDGSYRRVTGTSLAAPHAAAIIARELAHSASPPERVLADLRAAALDLGTPGYDETFGYGKIRTSP